MVDFMFKRATLYTER